MIEVQNQVLAGKVRHISSCLELAILLEVSADKPGNVNLVVGFEGTNHAHFLASAVAVAPHLERAAKRGMAVSRCKLSPQQIGIGSLIRDCVAEVNAWQRGGNTLLGTIMLLCPMAAAAGMSPMKSDGSFEVSDVRRNIKIVAESSTPEDAVAVYEAIKIAKPSGLGKAPDLDVNDPKSIERILKERITLYQVFQIASSYDKICYEWVNNFPVTFDFAYPCLMEQLAEGRDLNTAIIHTFLKVLSEYPDTFIARKVGIETAKDVSAMARDILEHGGLASQIGRNKLHEFDAYLRRRGNLLNPGTTADIIAAALALSLLSGYRP